MRTVSISWDKPAGRFTALGKYPEQTISINAPDASGEPREPAGFSASELLLAGAGACAAWDVVEILRKRRAHVDALDVIVEGDQQPHPPWTYRRISVHFRLVGDGLRPLVIARVVRLSVVRYCSVISTLAGVAAIEATVEVVAADGSTTGRRHVELAIPAVPLPSFTEPVSDEDEPPAPVR